MGRPTFVASIDVRTLCGALGECNTGQLLTYRHLSQLIGRDVQTEARAVLGSARKIMQRERGFVFGTVIGEGLKRLNDVEIVQTGAQTIVSIRHASRRGAERVAKAAPEQLPLESRVRMNTYLSVLAMLHAATTERRIKKLEARVAQAESRLPLDKTLEAFKD
jgi:hypothetical protein